MTAIKINTFGGILPSVDPRNLPAEGAQTAQNLSLRFGDFRPLRGPGASVATVAAGTKSIFRTPSGVWLSSTNDVNYVNGQINDAATERVYLTGRQAYPEAWQGGSYRRLGVPAPVDAPAVVVVEGEQFSTDDADDSIEATITAISAAVSASLTLIPLGNAKPPGGAADAELVAVDPTFERVAVLVRGNAHASPTFTDFSKYGRTLTAIGGVTNTNVQSKYGGTSLYFPAAGGRLTMADAPELRPDAGAFTIEAWVRIDALNAAKNGIASKIKVADTSGGWGGWEFFVRPDGGLQFNEHSRPSRRNIAWTAPGVVAVGVWVHVAVVRSGSGVLFFADGTLLANNPSSTDLWDRKANDVEGFPLGLGESMPAESNTGLNGHMDDFRFTPLVARYTATFTPPAAELPLGAAAVVADPYDAAFAYVDALLRADNAGQPLQDDGPKRHAGTLGSVVATSAQFKWGGASAEFDGGVGITYPGAAMPAATSWCVEGWVRITAGASAVSVHADATGVTRVSATVGGTPVVLWARATRTAAGESSIISGGTIAAATWVHVALVNKANTETRLYVNGTSVGTSTARALQAGQIGYTAAGDIASFAGWMDDYRVTNGFLRYSGASLTVPTGPFGTFRGAAYFWLQHGESPELPTSDIRQVAYCVPMVLKDGQYVMARESNNYLLEPAFNGKRITYLGNEYWAIPAPWQANGYTVDEVALSTAIKALRKPPENTAQLVPDATADSIAATIAGYYDATRDPALSLVANVNRQQNDIVQQVSRTDSDPTRASSLLYEGTELATACNAVQAYYSSLNTDIPVRVRAIVDNRVVSLLPTAVELAFETRGYIVTYVTDWGEESAPSPPSALIVLDQNDGVDVTIVAPTVASPYGPLTNWRLYRSSSTNTGAAYQLVAEVPIATLTYTDNKLQEALDEVCQTLTWAEPRADMIGLVGLPNGIMAGFFEETLCFSEPFAPHAWPREYEIPLEFQIVGLGVFGQTLVVLTEGNPYYASGADSASMSAEKLESSQSCVSKRSIVSMEGGVVYASPDGICLAGPGGPPLIVTQGKYTRDDWQALGLATSFAGFSEGVYYIVTEV